MSQQNVFEKYPKTTLTCTILLALFVIYGFLSWKIIKNEWTEHEKRSLKTILIQKYYAGIIDKNIGRFIKLREYRPNLETFERPSKKYMSHAAPSLERKYYKVSTDENGFLNPSNIYADPDLKIVFLGGSTTECLYVDELKRFPYLVGRQLEQILNKKVNSYNGGVSANESLHSLNILLNKVIPMQPNVVVFMHNINDLIVLRSQGTYWYPNSLKSHIQTSKNVFTRFELPTTAHSKTEKKLIEAFKKNLRTFIAIAKIHGITPILMTQANRVSISEDPLYHQFNQEIRALGKEEGVTVIDLADEIPRTEEMIYDHYHYTENGSILAAKIISEKLVKVINN